jgi:arsenite methyltransferase
MTELSIRPAEAADWSRIADLLSGADLPREGVAEHLNQFLVAYEGDSLVGVAGLEPYGSSALLRSVAVAPLHRKTGLGGRLVRQLIDRAAGLGVRQVGLLTTTAADYFPRFGFAAVPAGSLPADLQQSREFQGACPSSATAMLLTINAPMNAEETRAAVRERYARAATGTDGGCCAPSASSCCGGLVSVDDLARTIGYGEDDLQAVPEGANLGLGCGNPHAIASLKPGETVLDLGAGAGFDAFLAARQVGETGRVIGVDMTPEMVRKARENAARGGLGNVEFRLGEIEHMPVADSTVDVVISNCVINLSPEKPAVFAEAFRVLKPGGRLAVSDMVTSLPLPPEVQRDVAMYTGCIAGAASVGELNAMLKAAGFTAIRITPKDSRTLLETWGADTQLEDVIFSAMIQATRPA